MICPKDTQKRPIIPSTSAANILTWPTHPTLVLKVGKGLAYKDWLTRRVKAADFIIKSGNICLDYLRA